MAQVFIQRREDASWRPHPLADIVSPFRLGAESSELQGLEIVSFALEHGAIAFALLASPERDSLLFLNGEPLVGGLHVLAHRDELLASDGARLMFSRHSRPEVSEYRRPEGRAARCPVCRDDLQGLVVRCPQCGLQYHEQDDRRCWSETPHCRGCDHPTDLTGANLWRPEDEEAPSHA